jgi:anti-sigma factor ChrR (cupin superfamily)
MTTPERLHEIEDCCSSAALYALGALPPEEERQFRQRIQSGCPLCTAESAASAEVANLIGMSLPPVQPPASVRERLLDRIRAKPEGAQRARIPRRETETELANSSGGALHPVPVLRDSSEAGPVSPHMTLVRENDSTWIPSPFPGVELRPLLGRNTLLVRMHPGSTYPSHEHRLAEQCYVLEGSVTDSDGVTVYAGDFVCMHAGSTHESIHTDTGCLFLITYV